MLDILVSDDSRNNCVINAEERDTIKTLKLDFVCKTNLVKLCKQVMHKKVAKQSVNLNKARK